MSHIAVVIAAALGISGSPGLALATDNSFGVGMTCLCTCQVLGSKGETRSYDQTGDGCGILGGKTCNISDPETGGTRSGKLVECWDPTDPYPRPSALDAPPNPVRTKPQVPTQKPGDLAPPAQ